MFGEATVHWTDKLDMTIGLRQHDQSGYTVNMSQVPGVTAAKPLDPTSLPVGDPFAGADIPSTYTPFQFDKLTSRLALQNQFNDNIMGYVSYSEGFNSGGVSAAVIGTTRTLFPFKPATLKNTEIGMRSDLADGKVRFNATVFDTDWEDLQAAGVVTDPVDRRADSDARDHERRQANAKGVEIEVTFVPIQSLQINLGLGFLDTAYTEIKPGTHSGHLPFTTGPSSRMRPTRATRSVSSTQRASGAVVPSSRVSTTTTRVSSGGRSRSCASAATQPCLMATRRAVTGASRTYG